MKMQQQHSGVMRPERRLVLPPTMKRGPDTVWGDYNEINIDDSLDERKAKLEQWIAMRVGSVLMKHYNQREWKVIVDIEGGILIVACDSICNIKGYHIKLESRTIDELERRAVMAAGEILERHNVSRARNFDPDIIETLARDAHDSVIADDSAPEPV